MKIPSLLKYIHTQKNTRRQTDTLQYLYIHIMCDPYAAEMVLYIKIGNAHVIYNTSYILEVQLIVNIDSICRRIEIGWMFIM